MTLFDVAAPEGATIQRSAIVSKDGMYRYSLARWWDIRANIKSNDPTKDPLHDTFAEAVLAIRRFERASEVSS